MGTRMNRCRVSEEELANDLPVPRAVQEWIKDKVDNLAAEIMADHKHKEFHAMTEILVEMDDFDAAVVNAGRGYVLPMQALVAEAAKRQACYSLLIDVEDYENA